MSWLDRQNAAEALQAFAASDTAWGYVQRLRLEQLALVVALPVLLAIGAQFWSLLANAASIVGFGMTMLDVTWLTPRISKLRSEGAAAQDRFDEIALSLKRPNIRAMTEPWLERLLELAAAQPPSRSIRNRNWYSPELAVLPLPVGRIAAMRESTSWDGGLRDRWSKLVLALAVVLLATFVCVAFFSHVEVQRFLLSSLFPLTPATAWALREWREQRDASERACRLYEGLRSTWSRVIAGGLTDEDLSTAAIDHAWLLHLHRASTSPVPHRIYLWLRDRQTNAASQTARALIEEYDHRSI